MSLKDCRGAAWAFAELMAAAQADIDRGEAKPAVRKWKTANPAKVRIGWFAAKRIRAALMFQKR